MFEAQSTEPTGSATGFSPTAGRPPRALVLDHNEEALRDVRRSLEARGFTVLTAGDGTSGLALLLDEVLVLDALVIAADLPHRDARSFAHLIRRAGGEQELAIVVVARELTTHLRSELLALQTDAVLDRSAGPGAVADAVLAARARRSSGGAAAAEPTMAWRLPCAA